MTFQIGDVVRATITSNNHYLISREANAFVGIVVGFSQKEVIVQKLNGIRASKGVVEKMHVISLYGLGSSIFSYYQTIQKRGNQGRPTYQSIEDFFSVLFSNQRIYPDNFSFFNDLRSFDVLPEHFEKIENTFHPVFKKQMQDVVATLHIYERKIDPYIARKTTETVDHFFEQTEIFATTSFHSLTKPNLSL